MASRRRSRNRDREILCVGQRMKARPVLERFWEKVQKLDGCWLWTAASRTQAGYGLFTPRHGIKVLAHRAMWEYTQGSVPAGLYVCHRCDNPGCVNPAHLFLGSHADNMRDMVAKGRARNQNLNATHCRAGHEFTEGNTYILPKSKKRQCRECNRQRFERHYVRRGPITHCPSGHPYDEANTCICRGARHCRACNNARSRARRAKGRAA